MPLEETNPRLEAIIMEVKTRQTTRYEGYVPRADEMLVAEIERLRASLRELVDAVKACRKNCLVTTDLANAEIDIDDWNSLDTLAAEIDKELKGGDADGR